MADVKVPALLHKMSVSSQKAWYKKHGMEMPDDTDGRSAAAAKKIKLQPRKVVAIEPDSVRAINAARQKKYMEKGGRQPIGAAGSGGSSVMAGSNMSTEKGIVTGIKAGFNPRLSLDPYESERAKKVGPRSLNRKDTGRLGESAEQMDEGKKPFAAFLAAKAGRSVAPDASPSRSAGKKGPFAAFSSATAAEKEAAAKKVDAAFSSAKTQIAPDAEKGELSAAAKAAAKFAASSLKRNEEVEQVEEARVDHREFATAGIMHPDMAHAPRMKIGNMTDFYSRKNGDKLHGKILSNDNKTVRIEHEGKVHKFDVRRSMPTSMYKEDKDDREYGYEGDMAMSQLKSIIANAQRLHDMLEPETDLPEWVQSKITLAEDYVVTATNYCAGELDEEVVVEGSEGKTPETETEVNLAKKHGDPNKITYGDVIKARIQSAKNKALKKGD